MPERLRTLVNHLRRFVIDRRHAPRYPARLPAVVSPVPAGSRVRGRFKLAAVEEIKGGAQAAIDWLGQQVKA